MGSTTGSIILTKKGKQVTVGITAPSAPKLNELWLDTAENTNLLKYWNGTSWIRINDVSGEFTEVYETLQNNYYTKEETGSQITTQIGSATITKSDGTVVNMKNALNEVIDTADGHTQTIRSIQSDFSTFSQDITGFKQEVSATYTTKNEFDNLEIGGRNLLRSTKTMAYGDYIQWIGGAVEKETDVNGFSALTIKATGEWNSLNFYFTDFDINSMEGKNVVISAFVKSSGLVSFPQGFQMNAGVFNSAGSRIKYAGLGKFDDNRYNHDRFTDNEWVKLVWIGTLPLVENMITASSSDYTKYGIQFYVNNNNSQYPLQIKQVKCEFGNKATDWTPAPEDTETEITAVRSAITQNADNISLIVEGTDSDGEVVLTDNALRVIADNIDLSGKVTFNSLDASTQDKVNSALETAEIANQKMDNLEIGGTNILKNYNQYTETNKLKVTATKDNYYGLTSARVTLEEGKPYTFSCKTDGIWGFGNESTITDTVEAYLLLNGKYDTYFRLDSNDGFTFTAPADGEYQLRIDVNKNGITHYFWNFKIERGNQPTDYAPNPQDMASDIESTKNIAASADSWITDNGANMTALRSMILQWTKNAVSDTTTIDGGWISTNTITSKQIAANTITAESGIIKDINADVITSGILMGISLQSTNLQENAAGDILEGSKLNLIDGSFTSPNLSWDSYGNLTANNGSFTGVINATGGQIGNWKIDNGAIYAEYGTGTAPGTLNRYYLQPFTAENYEETHLISSQYASIDSAGNIGSFNPYWYITGFGDIYTMGDVSAGSFKGNSFTIDNSVSTLGRIFSSSNYLYVENTTGHKIDLRTDDVVRATSRDGNSFKPMCASAFVVNSKAEYKQNIEPLSAERAMDLIEHSDIYAYMLKEDVACGKPELKFGCIIGNGYNTPMELMNYEQTGIQTADMLGIAFRGLQVLSATSKAHEKRISELENEVAVAKALISHLQQTNT